MHLTSSENAQRFFSTYVKENSKIVEIGAMSQPTTFQIRNLKKANSEYIGVDIQKAFGVDIVLTDPYKLPFEDESVDVVISTSNFEHVELYWVMYLEIMRILKPNGLFYLNAPSCGSYHKFPVDCWRFYPDSGNALVNWGRTKGYTSAVLEHYTSHKKREEWEDYVCIFVKDEKTISEHQNRIIYGFNKYYNGKIYEENTLRNPRGYLG